MKEKINNWQIINELQGIILIGLSLVIFKLYTSGQIFIFLSSQMVSFVLFTMIAMFLLGWFRVMNSDMYGADCGCEACDLKGTSVMGFVQYGILFILPLMIAFNLNSYYISDVFLEKRVFKNHIQLDTVEREINIPNYNYTKY